MLVIDAAAILALHHRRELPWLLERPFALILGESPDRRRKRFIGWEGPFRDLTFTPGNLLSRVLQSAWRATWQNGPTRDLLHALKRPADVFFFPIAGYQDRDVIGQAETAKDIDILIYGGMSYARRANFALRLFGEAPSRRTVVCSNVFELDDLLRRTRTVVHVNSVEGCYHIPYAKIMKPLANHKILFVEHAAELEQSDLRPLLRTFVARRFADFLKEMEAVLNDYPNAQATLDALNPSGVLREHYDFEAHVCRLFDL
jgi:hypothetical protein